MPLSGGWPKTSWLAAVGLTTKLFEAELFSDGDESVPFNV